MWNLKYPFLILIILQFHAVQSFQTIDSHPGTKGITKPTSYHARSLSCLSLLTTPVVDCILSVDEDPIEDVVDHWQQKNWNEIINTGFVVVLSLAILWYITTANFHISRGWTAEEYALHVPVDAWLSYSKTLADAPIFTKAVTSATVYGIGDVIAQRTEGTSVGDLDRMRTGRSVAAGLLGHGPLSHVWYNVCDGLFDNVLHMTAWWVFFPKVLLDQLTWGPFWNNTYILLLGIMKMDKWEDIWGNMKRTTIPLIVSGLKLWPAAHMVTYGLIPVENRLLWVDLVEILWVTILATQASGVIHEEHVAEQRESDSNRSEERKVVP